MSSKKRVEVEYIDYEEGRSNKKNKTKPKRKRSVGEKIVIWIESIIIAVFALMIVVFAINWHDFLSSPLGEKALNSPFGPYVLKLAGMDLENYDAIYKPLEGNQVVNDDLDTSILDEYMNIALLGLDKGSAADRIEGGDSCDCIMVLSIHKETSEVKIVSVYRDTYLNIINADGSERKYYKVNSTYAGDSDYGGAASVINTLNTNLDLNISDYVMVNFNGIATIIDQLGGIDVTITEEERQYINGYLTETRKITGMASEDVMESGNVHLNGLQATAYSRIRKTAIYFEDGTSLNNDYGRAARQRLVIMKMVAKAKEAGVGEVLDICDTIFASEEDVFQTSIRYEEAIALIPIVLKFSFGETAAFPFTHMTNTELGVPLPSGSTVLAAGLEYNVTELHEYLFPEESYSPSSTVRRISEEIAKETGIWTIPLEEE